MSVTLYQHELLWDICNARGVIIIVYSGIKKTLPDYFLSDHELRCSFLGSVRALSGVVTHSSPDWLIWDICSENLITQG